MPVTATQFIQQTYQKPYRAAVLRREVPKDTATLDDTSDPYNEFIWALARKFTNSAEEAEAAVNEMFADIRRCAEKGLVVKSDEDRLVARIAWRRLIKFLQ